MKSKTLKGLVLAASAVALLLTLNLVPLVSSPPTVKYSEGDVVGKDLYAPISFPLPKDSSRLREQKDSAAALVLPVLELKKEVETQWLQALRDLRSSSSVAYELTPEERGLLSARLLAVGDSILGMISSQGYFREKEDFITGTVVVLMGDNEVKESLDNILGFWDADTLIENSALRYFPNDPARAALLTDILRRIVLSNPNLVYNKDEFDERRKAVTDRISPYEGFVERGELIAEANSRIDKPTLKKIEALNAEIEGNWKVKIQLLIRQNLLFLLILLLLGGTMYLLKRDLEVREILYVTVLLVVGVAASLFLRRFSVWWFIPTGFIALAAALFFGPLEGILLAGFTSMLLYIPWQDDPEYLVYALVTAVGALLALSLMRRRIGFLAALGFLVAAGLIVRASFIFTRVNFSLRELTSMALGVGINSILNIGFLVLMFLMAEGLFGFTSAITLSELADLNRPLFRDFVLKAPGTYHHSILIGNLAERAARIIGANPALALAGGYYHDIGKMAKPQYFIENQIENENPHDFLKPRMSALILASHVKEGLVMAERLHLPRSIRDIIAQHQGTTRMEYFYRKHLEASGEDALPEEAFRYPGPKPQAKEAALVMLADSVEATVRAQGFEDREDLEELIKKVIESKVSDGQLDECAFTTSDIHKVRGVFASTLSGIFHPRIRYEKEDNSRGPKKNARKNGSSKARKKSS